jgi:hypothetical protein
LERTIQDLSGVTINEWVEIRSTLTAIDQDKFNCMKCQAKYESRADGEQMLAKVKANMGCTEMKQQPIHKIGAEVSFRSCIGNFVKPQVYALISAHHRYTQGVMPYAGGYMEQPAKIMDVFGIIDQHRAEVAELEREKAERAARGGARGK